MSKENTKPTNLEPSVNDTIVSAKSNPEGTKPVTASPVKVLKRSFDSALEEGIKSGKTFPLVRTYYTSERNGRAYYSYCMFLVLPGSRQKFERIELVPDIGFIDKKQKSERTAKNSDAYRLLNWFCDIGGDLSLCANVERKKDDNGIEQVSYQFFARVYDDTGIPLTFPMKTRTTAQSAYLRAGFAGAGRSRAVEQDDFKTIPELMAEFQRICELNESMPDDIEDDYES